MSNYYDNWGLPQGIAVRSTLPRDDTLMCVICKHSITDEQSYALLPYPSRYDGECVCGVCCATHIDPVIDETRRTDV